MGNKATYEKLDALVLRAIQGDKKSFEKLCQMEAPQIIYSCTKLMGNTLDGEDAAQEVFISMQRRLPTLKTPEAFVSWIQKMIYYVCANMRQKNMNSANTLPIEELADLFSETDSTFLPEEYIHEREKSKELMEIIDNLPDQIRACILMHYFSEMKISESASVLGISEGSVKGYLYVGREKIRKVLKEREQQTYLHSGVLLPMAALGQLFHNEMQESITPEMVQHCLSAAGITTFSFKRWFAQPVVKDMAVAAACTLAAAGLLSIYSYVASNSPATTQGNMTLHQSSPAQIGGDEDMEGIEPGIPGSGIPPRGPGGAGSRSKPTASAQSGSNDDTSSAAPQDEAPESGKTSSSQTSSLAANPAVPLPPLVPPPAAVATKVKGALAVKNAESINNLDQLFDKQYYATIEQSGKQFALTMIDSKGQFSFTNLSIVESGTYTLHIKNIYSHGLVFSADNPSGAVEINLTPGQEFKLAQPLWVVDDEPPVVAVSILDMDGKQNPVNPAVIQIDAYDATKLTIGWKIQPNGSGEVVTQGSSSQVDSSILNGLPEGYYIILINVSDALGHETTVSGAFYAGRG